MKWILAIVSALLLAAWGRGGGSQSRSPVTETEEWTIPREGANALDLRTPAGNIQVVGTAVEQLQVRAFKRARGDSDVAARAFLEQMKIERRREGDRWVVAASRPEPRPGNISEAAVDFEVQVPRGIRLEVESGTGNIDASGVRQPRLQTGAGNLHVDGCTGSMQLETGAGNIQVEKCSAPVDAHAGAGNIEIRQGEDRVKATTGTGNLRVEIARASRAAQVELETGSGNVELDLPEDASARVEANTNRGHVQLVPSIRRHDNRSDNQLHAVLGDGQGSVRLRTGIGNIDIRLTAIP